ncbi:MAG: DNA-binding protein WhiA [bacterium]|nr:DNA-binding protein WhiA [bacterium]
MSFSSDVKQELAGQIDNRRHCQLAELMALLSAEAKLEYTRGGMSLCFCTENELVAAKYRMLVKKLFDIDVAQEMSMYTQILRVDQPEELNHMLMGLKVMDANGKLQHEDLSADGLLLQKSCCKRAFARGAFLASGSISNPEKSYHFEIVCPSEEKAILLQQMYEDFDLDAKIVLRKKHYIVYLKEGAQIVDALNVMGAHVALMNLENVRIIKEMRNSVNRKVNCETANINKVVNAACRQVDDIRYIQKKTGLDKLPVQLREMAYLRLEYPDVSLKELGELCDPPVGKSGVNHRLRKISEMAKALGRE